MGVRPNSRILVSAVLAALIAFGAGRRAEAVAPRRIWRTFETRRFHIHFHEGGERIASRVAPIAERALDLLEGLLGNAPEVPIQLVITDETDSANGFTQVLPYNLITIYPVPPEPFGTLGDYDDYLTLLVTHELTHVVHLDTIGGLPALINAVIGKQFAPNQLQPRWFIEGIAVYAESRTSAAGRVRSALTDMIIREQVLVDVFPSLDEISTSTRRFPGGNFAYLLGGRFLDFIARQHGPEAVAKIARAYGSRLIPYGLNVVAREATGKDYVELWDAWRAEEVQRARARQAKIEREGGVVEGSAVMLPTTEVYHPRFSSTGELFVLETPRDDDAGLVVLTRDLRAERARFRTSGGAGAFTPDGERLVASITDTYLEKFSYSDLEVIDLATGRRTRRTRGARLDQPDVSPDGKTIVAVQRSGAGSWLVTLSIDGRDAPVRLTDDLEGEDVASPRWSPDGRAIVASVHRRGLGRQIVVYDLVSGGHRDLTAPRAQDLDPTWSPDGGRVLFSSDRGGVYNIWSVDVRSSALERLTNVDTGAFEPAIDPAGKRLAFVHGTVLGYGLRILDLEDGPTNLPLDPPSPRPLAGTASVAVPHQERPYSAWSTILPRAYLPSSGEDGVGSTYGILVSGQDALDQHEYQLLVEYGTESHRFGYDLAYRNMQSFTPVSLTSSFTTTTRPGTFVPPGGDRLESIFRTRIGVELPVGRWDVSQSLRLSYGIETRRGINLVSGDPQQIGPSPALRDLDLASIAVGWTFSNARAFADSISTARGQSLDVAVEFQSPALGSDLRVLSVAAHHSAFLQLPWLAHHVLAVRTALGGAAGDTQGRSAYSIGGLPVRNIFDDIANQRRVGADVIRGFPVASLRGNSFYLGTLEYRLPIVDLERGIETLPAFVDRLYAAGFVDAGDTPAERLDLARLHVGAGAEVRLAFTLGYYLPITARLGYGRGLTSGGINNVYLVLGGTF